LLLERDAHDIDAVAVVDGAVVEAEIVILHADDLNYALPLFG
jgi:hypothetical protein